MNYYRCCGIYSDCRKFETWLRMEREIIRFFNSKGLIDDVSLARIESDLEEKAFGILGSLESHESDFDKFHDFAFSNSSTLKRFSHLLTMNKDNFEGTYISLLLKDKNDGVSSKLKALLMKLKEMTVIYRKLAHMGRTHSVHAEPISFASKFAICWSSINDVFNFFGEFRKKVEVVVVDHTSFMGSPDYDGLQEYLADKLDLFFWNSNFSGLPKEKYLIFLTLINSMAKSLHKLALDLHFMNSDQIMEVRFSGDAQYSYEKIELFSNVINSNCNSLSSLLWNYAKSSLFITERIKLYLFESLKCFLNIMEEMNRMLDGMEVQENNMRRNMEISKNAIYSQAVMLHILKKGKFTREEVLEDMKLLSSRLTGGNQGFYMELMNSPKYGHLFSNEVLDIIFSPQAHLKYIDPVHKRAFGVTPVTPELPKVIWDRREIFRALDHVADRLNSEYFGETDPVTAVAFTGRSAFFLANIMTKLNFPLRVILLKGEENELVGKSLDSNSRYWEGRRVLIFDYIISEERNLNDFVATVKNRITPKDIKICGLLKSRTLDTKQIAADFWGLECEGEEEYYGFGRDQEGRGRGYLQLSSIGLSA